MFFRCLFTCLPVADWHRWLFQPENVYKQHEFQTLTNEDISDFYPIVSCGLVCFACNGFHLINIETNAKQSAVERLMKESLEKCIAFVRKVHTERANWFSSCVNMQQAFQASHFTRKPILKWFFLVSISHLASSWPTFHISECHRKHLSLMETENETISISSTISFC